MKTSLLCVLLLFTSCGAMAQLRQDERLVFFPGIVRQVNDGWELTVHGWVHEPEERRVLGAILRRVIGIDRDKLTDDERELYRARTRYFLPDNERRKVITVLAGTLQRLSPPTASSGHFKLDWKLSNAQFAMLPVSNQCFAISALLDPKDTRSFPGVAHVLQKTGVSIISDIDDTIKISEVRDREKLLLNTFCRPFKAAPGMPELYREWERHGWQFHYVSASPWQLYIPLAEFADQAGFPAGTVHMKDFRVKDSTFLALLGDPLAYKLKVITPLLERFPDRQFVLVGDSGEKDPEAYGALARKFPKQVKAVLIRNVTGEPKGAERYKTTFRDVPPERWTIFDHPNQGLVINLGLSGSK